MKSHVMIRTIVLAAGIFAACTPASRASFHLWTISEIFSTADGQVQFIEFSTSFSSQQFLSGQNVQATETAPPNAVHSFTFPGNLPGDTANKTFLMATPGFAGLQGGVTPDYTIPTGFLFTAGASLSLIGADTVVYTNLILDGVMSVDRTGAPAINSPRNFAGNEGSVDLSASEPLVNTNLPISVIGLTNDEVVLSWIATNTEKYDLLFTPSLTVSNTPFSVVDPNIKPPASGLFYYDQVPLRAQSLYEDNITGFYALQVTPDTTTPIEVQLTVVASNLVAPITLTHAGDGSGRRFIADQPGQIWILDTNDMVLNDPFLDISGLVTNLNPGYDERGFLGLAFHPQYTNNGRFFVYYSAPKTGSNINHQSIVAEYTVSATNENIADNTGSIVFSIDQPEFNHNGGALAFGPDGYLYIALGDGGGADDGLDAPGLPHGPFGNGQITDTLLGSILRIDVDGTPPYEIPPDNPFVGTNGLDEIFAYGFRNPFRMSFDSGGSNDLFVADVGQNIYEEIHVVEIGRNYGWRIMEGRHAFDLPLAGTLGVDISELEDPIHAYTHDLGISIIGGYVYRGTNLPALAGKYVFGDFSTGFGSPDGQIFYLDESRPGLWERFSFFLSPSNAPLGRYVKGFGEDEEGNIYLLSTTILGPSGMSGDVRLLDAPTPS